MMHTFLLVCIGTLVTLLSQGAISTLAATTRAETQIVNRNANNYGSRDFGNFPAKLSEIKKCSPSQKNCANKKKKNPQKRPKTKNGIKNKKHGKTKMHKRQTPISKLLSTSPRRTTPIIFTKEMIIDATSTSATKKFSTPLKNILPETLSTSAVKLSSELYLELNVTLLAPKTAASTSTSTTSSSTSTAITTTPTTSTSTSTTSTSTSTTSTSTSTSTTSTSSTTTTTTTTTTTKPCLNSTCETYIAATRGSTLITHLVALRSIPSGDFLFYYGSTASTYADAVKGCLAWNKTLITLEKQSKIDAVLNLTTGDASDTFWTSGSNEGENCDANRKYAWCSIEIPFSTAEDNFWNEKNATNSTSDRCIAVKKTVGANPGLLHASCDQKLPYLCERILPEYHPSSPECVSNFSCEFDPVRRKEFEDNKATPGFTFYKNQCGGKNYVLAGDWYAHKDILKVCCWFGLRPASIETMLEFQCINSFNLGNRPITMWTSGNSVGSQMAPRWCGSNELINVPAFKWNSMSGTTPSTNSANFLISVYMASTVSGSYLKNEPDTTANIFGICED